MAKFFTLLALCLVLSVSFAMAQEDDPGWLVSAVFDFSVTQSAYSDSWEGGEAGQVNWVGNFNASAEKQLSEKFNYSTKLKLSFGQTHIQDRETNNWQKPQKTTDLIDWEHVGRFTLGMVVDPYAAFRIQTQFVDASIENEKRHLTPLKLTESVGVARRFYQKDKDEIISRFGAALQQTIISGVTEDTTIIESGMELVTDASLTFSDKLKYVSKLTLFKALYNSESDDLEGTEAEDYWKAVDINWENTITAKITKIISVNLYTQLLYDKEVNLKGRFKETLGLGVNITLL